MPHYDWVIDTQPMAEEVSSVSKHVLGVNAAVVVMQTEVVRAENEAADQVCQNINTGFYTLIKSQISQKMAKLKSEIDSQLMELAMQQKSLVSLQGRMQKDYHMLHRRYKDTFDTLNKNLHNRIFELDKSVMTFVGADIASAVSRINRNIAAVPVNQKESLTLGEYISAGRTRYDGQKTIESIKSFVGQILQQRETTANIVVDRGVEKDEKWAYPVLIVENEGKNDADRIAVVLTPQFADNELARQFNTTVKNRIYADLPTYQWKQVVPEEQARVTGEFNLALQKSDASERVKDMMKKMYQASAWQTLKD